MKMPKTKQLVVIAIILMFAGFFLWGRYAEAGEARLGLGFGYTANEGSRSQQIMLTDSNRRWYGSYTRIGGDYRHNYHLTKYAIGYRVNWRKAEGFSPYLRLGWAYLDDLPFDYISDHHAFDMGAGVRLWGILDVEIEHNSTAGRSDQNEGLDTFMVGIVLPFR